MPKYDVHMSSTANATVTVEADSPEQAEEVAEFPSICAQCSGWGRDHSLEIGDDWEIEEAVLVKNES